MTSCLDILPLDLTSREGNVRLIRNSLRIPRGGAVRAASAALALSVGVACGGGGAATPTPTGVPAAATVAAVPAASPQRPPLASPGVPISSRRGPGGDVGAADG